jgi:hypothetical protein
VASSPDSDGTGSTVRWSGSGERDGKAYERNQRLNVSQEHPPGQTWRIGCWVRISIRRGSDPAPRRVELGYVGDRLADAGVCDLGAERRDDEREHIGSIVGSQ